MNATIGMPLILSALLAGAVSAQSPSAVRDSSPHSSAQVTVNGVTLHYLDWGGSGDVVLLLSGLGNDAHVFDDFATTLTDRFRVVGLTRRGFGESSKPATGYTTSIRVEDILMFLDALTLDRVHLVGHSFAGDELTLFAGRYPTRVDRLVYIEAAYDRSGSVKMALDDPTSSAFNRRLTMEALGQREAAAIQLPSTMVPPPDVLNAIVASLQEMNTFKPDFSAVRAPVLALYAMNARHANAPARADSDTRQKMDAWWRDVFTPWQRARIQDFRRQQPGAEVVEISDATHFLFMGATRNETVRRVREFLSR